MSDSASADRDTELAKANIQSNIRDPLIQIRNDLQSTRDSDELGVWQRRQLMAEQVKGMLKVQRTRIAESVSVAETAIKQQADLFRVGFQDVVHDLIKTLQDSNLLDREAQSRKNVMAIQKRYDELAAYRPELRPRAEAALAKMINNEMDNFEFMIDQVHKNIRKRTEDRFGTKP